MPPVVSAMAFMLPWNECHEAPGSMAGICRGKLLCFMPID